MREHDPKTYNREYHRERYRRRNYLEIVRCERDALEGSRFGRSEFCHTSAEGMNYEAASILQWPEGTIVYDPQDDQLKKVTHPKRGGLVPIGSP